MPRARWRPRPAKPGQMNQTEVRYAAELEIRRVAGEIVGWRFEPLRLRLGADWKTSYTPDFLVLRPDGEIELVDVKGSGGWEEDARVKIKVAAGLYPEFHFVAAVEQRRGGGFVREEFASGQ